MIDNVIYVLKTLMEYSDKDHPVTQIEIIKRINEDFSCDIDRRTVKSSIDALNDLGYDIVSLKKGEGYYYDKRIFTKNEATYLMDAIYSSKVLDNTQAKNLVNKIKDTFSVNERKDYKYLFKNYSDSKLDETIFDKIDIITQAIKSNKQIEYRYCDYDKNGIERISDNKRATSPYYFINSNSKYYILSVDKKGNLFHYRLDRMKDIQIIDDIRNDINKAKGYKAGFNIQEYAKEHIYMFDSEIINAKLLVKAEKYVKDVIDWFGSQSKITSKGDEIYASIKCDEQSLIYWSLQYSDEITVISPIDTRLKISRMVNNLKNEYINDDIDITRFKIKDIIDGFVPSILLMNNYFSFTYDELREKLIKYIENYYFSLIKCEINSDGLIEIIKNNGDILYRVNFKYLTEVPTRNDFYGLLKDIMISENNNTYNFVFTSCNKYYFIDEDISDNYINYFSKYNEDNLPLKFNIKLDNGDNLFYENIHKIKWTIKKGNRDDFYGYYLV